MTLTEGKIFLRELIARGKHHPKYKKQVEEADLFAAIVYDGDLKKQLLSYKKRETEEQKKQREDMFFSPTGAVTNEVLVNFNNLETKQGKIQVLTHSDIKMQDLIRQMIDRFNGDRTLDRFLLDECRKAWTTDPNSFLVCLFSGERDLFNAFKEKPRPRAFVVPSSDVYDVGRINGEYKSLCTLEIMQGENDKRYKKYTLYFTDYVIIATEINAGNADDIDGEGRIEEISVGNLSENYQFFDFNIQSGEVPFMPFGYEIDSDGEGYTSFLFPVLNYYLSLINDAAELALTKALHVFVKGYAYADKCSYTRKGDGRCDAGRLSSTNVECPRCKGTGMQLPTTVQDLTVFTLPEEGDALVPLREMIYYPTFPFEIVNYLTEMVDGAAKKIETALWGVYLKETPAGNITATEIVKRYGSVYAKLSRMEQHIAKMWEKCVRLTGKYAEISEGLRYQFVARDNFSMEELGELLVVLKAAKDAFAPHATILAIENQIMEKQEGVTDEDIQMANAVQKFRPFIDKNEMQIAEIILGLSEKDYYRVLWIFFGEIFSEITEENPLFHKLDYLSKKAIVDAKVAQFSEKVGFMSIAEPSNQIFENGI